jgi:hypothetical protein
VVYWKEVDVILSVCGRVRYGRAGSGQISGWRLEGGLQHVRKMVFVILSFYSAIFLPTILFEPVFQPAKFGSLDTEQRRRHYSISRSEEYRQNYIRFLWKKIQLRFPFKIKFETLFNPPVSKFDKYCFCRPCRPSIAVITAADDIQAVAVVPSCKLLASLLLLTSAVVKFCMFPVAQSEC